MAPREGGAWELEKNGSSLRVSLSEGAEIKRGGAPKGPQAREVETLLKVVASEK